LGWCKRYLTTILSWIRIVTLSFEPIHMARIAYYRVSTTDQSIEAQRHALLHEAGAAGFDKEFMDEGFSGATQAAQRPAFGALLAYVREGDSVHVYAVDRLGRDAIDVQTTVRGLIARGVTVHVRQLGAIAPGVGELILAVLAQVAEMEMRRIRERTAAGRARAKVALVETGKTHRGKVSMGRPVGRIAGSRTVDPKAVAEWRQANKASITATAAQFELSQASVKRYCAASTSPRQQHTAV
jgi:putative DNA-invertase from lambdoid prophage Rac